MVTVIPEHAPAPDVDALIDRVGRIQETQRAEDVEGFLALFSPDAVWVNGAGRRLRGLDEIAEVTRRSLPGAMTDRTVDYGVELVQFLSPDIALTGVVQQYLDRERGRLQPPALGSPTYVWRRTAGGWELAVGQNTTYTR